MTVNQYTTRCPECGVSWKGKPIPEHQRSWFGAEYFMRQIAIYDQERDRTVAFECPDCKRQFGREILVK